MKNKYFNIYLGLLLLIGFQANADSTSVTGKLTDAKGNPISGAKVALVSLPETYSITNQNGVYTLEAEEGDTVVVSTSSHLFKKAILSQDQIIVLGPESFPVNNGAGTIKSASESTASSSIVFADRLDKSSAHLNASNALFGELLGLNVLGNSGVNDGRRAVLNFRGMGTPMILVDGFERDINDITVEEIESVTLLKDAASLAIYGMRGSNGIVLVTTKRGKYNSVEFDFSYDRSFNFTEPVIPMVNAYDYAMGLNEGLANDGLAPQYNQYQLDAFKNQTLPHVYPNVNWAKETLKNTAFTNSYNMQIRGGGNIVRYFTSVGYENDKGIVKVEAPDASIPNQFQYSNLNVRTNLDISISKSTLVSINLLGRLKENSSPILGQNPLMSTIYNTPAAAFPVKTENDEWGSSTTWTKNPVADLATAGFFKYHTRTLLADFSIDQNLDAITKGLRAKVSLAYDADAVIFERKDKDYRTETITTNFDENGNPMDVQYNIIGKNDGSYGFDHWLSTQYQKSTVQGLLDYKKSFGLSEIKGGYLFELTNIIDKGIQKTYNRINNSLFGSYAYDNRYFVDASLTMAASNRLDPSNKWGFFPSASAAWLISNEEALKQNDVVDFLKMRASWGIMGSDNFGFDLYKQDYDSGSSYYFGNFVSTSTILLKTLPVKNLTYAKTRSFNIGIEATLYGGLDLSLDLFHNREYDMLSSIRDVNSSVLGINPGFANNGERTFKGIELGIGYHKNHGDFKYAMNGKFSFNRSKIVNMNEDLWKNDFNKATGLPVGQIFGFEAIGFFKDKADVASSPIHTFSVVQAGDVKYKDQDGNGFIDVNDRVAIGKSSYMPELNFSFDVNLEYRNFGMNMMFQGIGNYSTILSKTSIYHPLINNSNISQHYFDNRWTPSNQDALYPRLSTELNENNLMNSTIWLQDLSFLKLRSAEIYYNLPVNWAKLAKLNKAKVFVRGYNLFSLDKMRVGNSEDPGINYPMYRTINVGLKFSF